MAAHSRTRQVPRHPVPARTAQPPQHITTPPHHPTSSHQLTAPQHYWTLKPGSDGQQWVPDGKGPDGEWHKAWDRDAHLTPYTKINGFDIETALMAGDKHHPSLGWRPENARCEIC